MEHCEFTAQVSELVDEELSSEETERITQHLEFCSACRDAHQSFLRSREQIRSYESVPDERVQERALAAIINRRGTSLWRGSMLVPLPAAAVFVIVMIGLIVWSVLAGAAKRHINDQSVNRITPPAAGDVQNDAPGAADIARFDRGERLVIYKEHRAHTDDKLR